MRISVGRLAYDHVWDKLTKPPDEMDHVGASFSPAKRTKYYKLRSDSSILTQTNILVVLSNSVANCEC